MCQKRNSSVVTSISVDFTALYPHKNLIQYGIGIGTEKKFSMGMRFPMQQSSLEDMTDYKVFTLNTGFRCKQVLFSQILPCPVH